MLQRNQKLCRPWTSKTITKSKIGLLLRSFDFCELTLFLGERLTASVDEIELKIFYLENSTYYNNGRVAQRITRLTTDQKIAGSNPAVLDNLFMQSLFNSNVKNQDDKEIQRHNFHQWGPRL